MKAVGIIAEYNPCHSGHAYQIREARKQSDADCVVIIMSGNFVQRGEPAILEKHLRTRMALSSGADLVIELPVMFSTDGAGGFARGGVSLMKALPNLTHISFGMEADHLSSLVPIAHILANESDEFKRALKDELSKGTQYALARARAIAYCHPDIPTDSILKGSNNILALEYLLANEKLSADLIPVGIKRYGAAYHDTTVLDGIKHLSAESIRTILTQDEKNYHRLTPYISQKNLDLIQQNPYFITADDATQLLQYALLRQTEYESYQDVDEDIANRIRDELSKGSVLSYSGWIKALKTKNTTYTHISRLLLHILLGLPVIKETSLPEYIHVLGMNETGRQYLHKIKKDCALPILTETSAAKNILSAKAMQQFEQDANATRIYQLLVHNKYHIELPDEYRSRIVIQ